MYGPTFDLYIYICNISIYVYEFRKRYLYIEMLFFLKVISIFVKPLESTCFLYGKR